MDTFGKTCRFMAKKNPYRRALFATTVGRVKMTGAIINSDLHKKCAEVLSWHPEGCVDILWGNVE
jgi:hypothetical protein